jgi:hypothetical protein
MSLKFKVNSKDEVPAEVQPLYLERDGALFLDVEGAVDKSKLDEFRANNVALMKQLEDFKTRYEGIDPASVKNLIAEKAKLEEAQQLKAGEIDKVVENRVRTFKGDSEKQLSALTAERDVLNARLVTIQIDQAVVSEASKRGLRPTAIPDITARARHIFKLVNGVPQAFEADGQTVRVGKDGLSPLTMAEWVEVQISEAPHLFTSNAGSGAVGNGSSGAALGSGINPFRKETWNLTEQMRLTKTDPHLAQRLKAAS